MRLLKLAILFFCLTGYTSLSAHEVWIESNTQEKAGTAHEVKIFFGEFSWGKPTPTSKWFSDIADCKLMLTAPDGKTQVLEKSKEADCYKAAFTPTLKGIYKLTISHVVKDVYKDMKLTYNAAAIVNVSAPEKESAFIGDGYYQLQVKNSETKQGYFSGFTVLEDGKPYENKTIEVSNTDSATHNLSTDKNGYVAFPIEWKGGHLIQFAHAQKEEGKSHNGKAYNLDYAVFTFYTRPLKQ